MTLEELKSFCDGSCLEHTENPNYCLEKCEYKDLWRKLKEKENDPEGNG